MNWKLSLVLWSAGMTGVVAAAWLAVPVLAGAEPPPVPMWVVSMAATVQSALLLALAVFGGTPLAAKVGLRAPLVSAMLQSRPWQDPLRQQLVPAAIGAVAGAALLWLFASFAPEPLAQVQNQTSMPLIVRVLYGGITEELLIRWGLMSLLVWLAWRVGRRTAEPPSAVVMWTGIAVSALVFGMGHLPAAAALAGPLSPTLIAYIVTGNALFGFIAGYLYWRHGIEAAIMAHALTHVLAFVVTG